MHLRKARKAKVAASEFVKRVISGKDVSPERKESSLNKGSRPSTPKLKTRGAVAAASRSQSKSPSRGRPSSPKPARPNSASSTPSTSSVSQRAASRSPSRAPETKPSTAESKATVKEEKPQPDVKASRPRGRPRKYPKVEKPDTEPKNEASKDSKKGETSKLSQVKEVEVLKRSERRKGSKSAESSPVAKVISSPKVEKVPASIPLTVSAAATKLVEAKVKPSTSKVIEAKLEVKSHKKKASPDGSSLASSTTVPKNQKIITPKIVFVDADNEKQKSETSATTAKPAVDIASVTPIKLAAGIKISPTAKLVPVCSLQNVGAMSPSAKGAFTISNASLLSLASQGTQFLVSSNPDGTFTTSAINVSNSAPVDKPGQFKIDLVELAKTVSAMTPQPSSSVASCETPAQPSTSGSPIYKKSPKLLLSASKHPKEEPISEGKIRKRKRSKIPDWEIPGAIYQTQFDSPQKEFVRKDSPIRYPEDKGMEKKDYFDIMGILNKADVKKSDGKEHRNHRLAGGKLRRVCKPKISPEMVYRRFSLARGCIMHDVVVDSDEEHDGNSPRVGDKTAVIRTEQSKKGSLSPKIHDSYRQHCNKIPVISIEKVNKGGSSSQGQTSPQAAGKVNNLLKENEPPFGKERGEGSSGGTPKSKKNKDKSGQCSKNSKSSKPTAKSKPGESKPVGKGLTKSKSFEVLKKSSGKATLTKTKSMPSTSHHKKVQPGPSKIQTVVKEEEEDDGTKRRSARFKGSKRKQWWHLLRANPDEFEEDKEWDKAMALQEAKKQARLDRQHIKEESEEEEEGEDEEEEEEEVVEEKVVPAKKSPKKVKKKGKLEVCEKEVKKEPVVEEVEEPPPKPKPKKKKKPTKEKTADTTEAPAKDSNKDDATQEKSKKEGLKRKASESNMEPPLKKVKDEPLSDPGSEDELEEKRIFKPKKKRSIGEKEEECEEKKKPAKDVVILGEDGEPLEEKYHTAVYDLVHTMLEHKEPEELAASGIMELSMPPYSPQSFIEILARQELIRRPQSPLSMLPIIRSDIVYKTKESECLAPHICSVCWINDHMYCRNMKRIARDLPLSGRCIHYVPCEHFRQKDSPSLVGRRRMNRKLHKMASAHSGDAHSIEEHIFSPPGVARRINFSDDEKPTRVSPPLNVKEELFCEEILTESDSEPHSPEAGPTPGTELLKYELRARAGQIKRSLGYRRLPQTISPMKRRLQGWTVEDTEEEVEADTSQVTIAAYGATEEVGLGPSGEPAIIPLSGDYVVKESSLKKEGWREDSSVFMPNTEEDAIEKDQDELGNVKQEAVYKDYEESLFGENSQDSTETSLSQNSVRDDDDSDESTQENAEAVSWDRERRRKKKRKKENSVFGPIKVESTCDASAEALKNKWQQSDDGTQVLTFTTKEIREKKPELLQYVKRAGLVGVITEKLQSERKSIQKLVKESDQALRQSQDKLEQHRCLMAAVLTEIVSVKEQLRDLQTALVDEEAMCVKLRKENRSSENHVFVSEKKIKTLRRILEKAKELSPPIGGQGDEESTPSDSRLPALHPSSSSGDGPETIPMDVEQLASEVKEEIVDTSEDPVSTSSSSSEVEIAMETGEDISSMPIVLECEGGEVISNGDSRSGSSGGSVDSAIMKPLLQENTALTNLPDGADAPIQEEPVPSEIPMSSSEITPEMTLLEEEIPQESVSTASVTNLESQVLNVQIEGGQSEGRMVMLELPLDNSTSIPATQADHILTAAPAFTSVGMEKPIVTENLLVEGPSVPASEDIAQIVSDNTLPHVAEKFGETSKPLQSLLQGRGESAEVSNDLKPIQMMPSIFGDNIGIQDVNLVSHNFQAQDLPSANLASQPQVTTAVTLPQGTNFENIILQSDDISNVLQTGNLADLPIQQADMSNMSNLIEQHGDLSKGGASMGGLMVQQASGSKQSDISNLSVQPGDLKRAPLSSLVMHPSGAMSALGMDSVNLGNILTDQSQLDNVLIQGNIGDNIILQQNPQDKLLVQTADSSSMLIPTTTAPAIGLPQVSSSGIFVQPGGNIIQQQQQPQPAPAPVEQSMSSILLQPNITTASVVTPETSVTAATNVLPQPAALTVPSTSAASMVIDPEVLLQNINLMPSQLGQVQTIMINGQPFEVVLQPADNV